MFNCFKSKKSASIAPNILKPGDIIHVWENKKHIKSVTIGQNLVKKGNVVYVMKRVI
tara:strand:- start:265 stop:435 length:171 start_codon:yes stop_codon:yes gene_type:complete